MGSGRNATIWERGDRWTTILRQAIVQDGQAVALLVWKAGLLRAQRLGSVDWMERRIADGTAQVDRTKSALFAVRPQRAGAQSGLPSFGSGLAGVAGAVAGSLWLHSAFDRELHRSGGVGGDLL